MAPLDSLRSSSEDGVDTKMFSWGEDGGAGCAILFSVCHDCYRLLGSITCHPVLGLDLAVRLASVDGNWKWGTETVGAEEGN